MVVQPGLCVDPSPREGGRVGKTLLVHYASNSIRFTSRLGAGWKTILPTYYPDCVSNAERAGTGPTGNNFVVKARGEVFASEGGLGDLHYDPSQPG